MLTFSLVGVFNAIKRTICLKAHTCQEQYHFVGPQSHLPHSLDNMCQPLARKFRFHLPATILSRFSFSEAEGKQSSTDKFYQRVHHFLNHFLYQRKGRKIKQKALSMCLGIHVLAIPNSLECTIYRWLHVVESRGEGGVRAHR